ncbi:MAG: PH domain-containing protein [Candidatus Kerfeldbacteria bacterium]|nr:PH domain-containing protein [Candidatus Kerfeldbacteria bacterium]
MFEQRLQKMLKAEELVVMIVRKYALVFTGSVVIAAGFIIAPFFFMVPLVRWGLPGIVIFVVTLCIGVFLGARIGYVYTFNVFVITEDRIIDLDQRGFFDRTVSETTYEKIQDVSIRIKGIAQTVFHYGSVIIQTAGNQANIELHGVKNPELVQQSIISVQRSHQEAETSTDNSTS